MRRSTLTSTLRGTAGLGIVEVLAVTVIVGIAVIGVALMFGKGSAWVSATGVDRVAVGLAQQRIEQIRACGWDIATKNPPEPGCPTVAGTPPDQLPATGLGPSSSADGTRRLLEEDVQAGSNRFTRKVCIQYVDPTTPQGLGQPVFTPDCPPGDATSMIRITVVVSSNHLETSQITLQAWMSRTGL